jgi:hypothetical protein
MEGLVRKFQKVAGAALVAALVVPLAAQAKVIKAMGSTAYLGKKISLDCYIDGYPPAERRQHQAGPQGHADLVHSEARECRSLRPDSSSAPRHSSASLRDIYWPAGIRQKCAMRGMVDPAPRPRAAAIATEVRMDSLLLIAVLVVLVFAIWRQHTTR